MSVELGVALATQSLMFGAFMVFAVQVMRNMLAQLEMLQQNVGRILLHNSELSAKFRQLEDRVAPPPAPVAAPRRGRKS